MVSSSLKSLLVVDIQAGEKTLCPLDFMWQEERRLGTLAGGSGYEDDTIFIARRQSIELVPGGVSGLRSSCMHHG